jgi:hypothetical protein
MPFGLGFFATAGVSASAGSFDLLESQVLTSNTASITFSNLNSSYGSSYQHLQLRVALRSNNAQIWEEVKLNFNGTTSGYWSHILAGTGSGSPFSTDTGSASYIKPWAFAVGANATANTFGAAVIDILDPFETTKNKTVRTLGGRVPSNGETRIALSSGLWSNTAAVTSIVIAPEAGSQWVTGSRFSLYGIKAA